MKRPFDAVSSLSTSRISDKPTRRAFHHSSNSLPVALPDKMVGSAKQADPCQSSNNTDESVYEATLRELAVALLQRTLRNGKSWSYFSFGWTVCRMLRVAFATLANLLRSVGLGMITTKKIIIVVECVVVVRAMKRHTSLS